MKKAQTEIIGLVIVIILVILGATFFIRYMMSREPVEPKKEFTQAELASNMLNTFLETRARNCEFSMSELLKNCGQGGGITCDNKPSCQYVEEAAKEIFDKTLDLWTPDNYKFKVFFDEDHPEIELGEKKACVGVSRKSKTYPIPTSSGPLSVKLDICN
jgi:hypothetical protein